MMMNEKFCVDCKWFVKDSYPEQCECPYITQINLVTGKRKYVFCLVERRDWAHENTCGTAGKHWEARDNAVVESNG
jgi:hypothetical protein